MGVLWTRRQVLKLSGASLAAALLPELAVNAMAEPATPAANPATSLYDHAFVLDGNTLASFGYQMTEADGAAHIQALRDSGLTALKTTLGQGDGTFGSTVDDIAMTQALIERRPDLFIKVTRADDLERARRERKIAIVLSFEAASMLEDKLERIDLFRHLDVLVMQLSYNRKSPFGYGCLDGDNGGVTELGRKAIARMNALGIALDLSHSNAQTTAEGIALSTAPVVITHAGCRSVFDHPRNKTDRDMKAMANKGGVMGVYMLPFLTEPSRQPMLADYIRHMVHVLDVCGEDHVGIGTDSLFFTVTDSDLKEVAQQEDARNKAGIGAPGENRPPYLPDANTPRKLEYVADALLKHGYSTRVAEKVLGLNFKRVFGEIWKTDTPV
jgi:membrane dipeptidase